MATTSGFFNAIETATDVFDRTYSAKDYSDNLATIIKNGVRYSDDDDLKVSAAASNSMYLKINAGRAWINGHYFYADTDYLELVVGTAPTGTYSRIDRVVLRLDESVAVRSVYLDIVQGTAADNPVPPELTRSGDVWEIGLATITVPAAVTAITDAMITDTRSDNDVCGWAASVTPAIMSLLRQYYYTTIIESTTTTVIFSIPQFRADEPQIVEVYTNGIRDVENVDYTRNGATITFTEARTAGAEITVVLKTSVDGTGLRTIVDDVTDLQNAVAALETDNEYIYTCNGATDNVLLSAICQSWLSGGSDYATKKIRVVGGNFGVTAAYSGAGTTASPLVWFGLGKAATTNRRIVIDFTNAGQINVPVPAGTYNNIFGGNDLHIIGASVIANQTGANTNINMFGQSTGAVMVENCRFWINATLPSVIATNGTFKNCRGSIAVVGGNAFCFYPATTGLIRVIGGEFYAYTTTGTSAVLYVVDASAVGILYAVNCPSVSRSGYRQSNAVYSTGGKVSITDTITVLPISATGANIRGTLAVNKAGLM